jgi:hypothetical protein
MSEHAGYIVKVEHLRPHTNADRLLVATFFGNDTCVSLDVHVGDLGVYFPTDLQLSEEFCAANNLVRKKDDAGNNIGGYMDPNKRNVTTIKLRGEKSDGLYLPISCFEYTGVDLGSLTVGTHIETVNGHEICCKYIPRTNPKGNARTKEGNRTRKRRAPVAPLFLEHADTEQLAYNLDAFKAGQQIEITLKMHGTSQRTGYLPVFQKYKRTLWDRILRREGTPIYDWGYVTGTRRTVLDTFEGGFYGSDEFRKPHAQFFEGKLRKGEEVYYEVVGFQTSGAPIMGSVDNKKTNDKDFIKQYGKTTTFSYGCAPNGEKLLHGNDHEGAFSIPVAVPQSDFYVYRMTMVNEDGDMVEYTPDYMRYRCEQMGCKCVPVFWKGYLNEPDDWTKEEFNPGEFAMQLAEEFYDGPDPVGKTHVREGVVVRIVDKPKFTAYKHKNFSFKCLEGIAKAEATAPDMEEAEEVNDSES